jgi:hypothetical protein
MTEVTGTGLREGDTVVVSTTTTTSGRIPGVGGIVGGPMGPF